MKIKAMYIPFFTHNTPEQLEKIAKALIDTPIRIGAFGIEVGKVINAHVDGSKIWWEGEIQNSTPL